MNLDLEVIIREYVQTINDLSRRVAMYAAVNEAQRKELEELKKPQAQNVVESPNKDAT